MDLILKAREMGKGIQASNEYQDFVKARIANDNDEQLQELINQFNLLKVQLTTIMGQEEKDEQKVAELDGQLKATYQDIMANENMNNFNNARQAMDAMMNNVNTILKLCVNGEDPDTCEVPDACGGSCSSCSGCH